MTLWHFNPSEPCANQTEPRLNGDATDNSARKCGDCPMVPEMWRLEIPAVDVNENPLFNGYLQSVFYLTRDPWRRADNSANNCGWTDGTFGPTNSDVTFRLSYEIAAFAGFANEAGWLLQDYRHKGNTPRNVWVLRNVRNCLTLLEGQPFERPAPFRCCCANRFEDISDVYEPRRFATLTPYNGICPAPDIQPPPVIFPDPVELVLSVPDPVVAVIVETIDLCNCEGLPETLYLYDVADDSLIETLSYDSGSNTWISESGDVFYCEDGDWKIDIDGSASTHSNQGLHNCTGRLAVFEGTVYGSGQIYVQDAPN